MTQSITKALDFIKYAHLSVILGSGITWTGVSYELAAKYHHPQFMAFMQVLSLVASFLGPFVALWFHSRSPLRVIMLGSELMATICCLGLFSLLLTIQMLNVQFALLLSGGIFLILLSGSIGALFMEPLYANLIERRDGSDKAIGSGFATFACWGILSKLGGMSLGPFIYTYFEQYSLLVNALTFLSSMGLLWVAFNHIPLDIKVMAVRPEQVTIFRKATWAEFFRLPLLETAIANSLIFVVVLAMSTQAMVLHASAAQLSLFWFGATGCAFFSHFIIGRSVKTASFCFKLEKKWGFLQVIPVCIGLMTTDLTLLLLAQWIFSFCNPLTTNQSRAEFYRIYGRDSKNALDAYAMRNILSNIIVLVFSLFFSFIEIKAHIYLVVAALAGLVILRWGISISMRQDQIYKKVEV